MAEAKKLVEAAFPNATFSPDVLQTGHGWRGYLVTENPQEVAQQEIHYLSEWYSGSEEFNYWISEPELGKFYFFYVSGNRKETVHAMCAQPLFCLS